MPSCPLIACMSYYTHQREFQNQAQTGRLVAPAACRAASRNGTSQRVPSTLLASRCVAPWTVHWSVHLQSPAGLPGNQSYAVLCGLNQVLLRESVSHRPVAAIPAALLRISFTFFLWGLSEARCVGNEPTRLLAPAECEQRACQEGPGPELLPPELQLHRRGVRPR